MTELESILNDIQKSYDKVEHQLAQCRKEMLMLLGVKDELTYLRDTTTLLVEAVQ